MPTSSYDESVSNSFSSVAALKGNIYSKLEHSGGTRCGHANSFSRNKKVFIVITCCSLTFNATLGSSLPSGGSEALVLHFGISDPRQISLPIALYLVGNILGPIIFGPLSETYGRWSCLVISFAIYTLSTIGCGLAPNWSSLLIFRAFCGIGAAAPLTILGGVFSDIYADLRPRGIAVTVMAFMATAGALVGPVISGYASLIDWRWTFWGGAILAALNWPLLWFMPETFEPVLALRVAKQDLCRAEKALLAEQQRTSRIRVREFVTVTLIRPFRMMLEPVVLFVDLFLLIEYSMFYLYFESYPFIFRGIYGMTSGECALMLLPVGIGVLAAMFICLWYDRYLAGAKARGQPWASSEEYRRLPLVCVGGPLSALSLFWLGWTAQPSIHWCVPMLSGVISGLGMDLIFMGLINYLTDSYGVYSASAMASSIFSRNIAAALLLPLASYDMYTRIGIDWSCSILGFLCLGMSIVPFAFIKYGPSMRERSYFCKKIREQSLLGENVGIDL